MLIVEALKKLYTKLGGSAADVANIDLNAEMVDKIADVAGGGSGGGVFVVTATNEDDVITFNKTWQEVHDALSNNIPVFVRVSVDDGAGLALTPVIKTQSFSDFFSVYTVPIAGETELLAWSCDSTDAYPYLED